MCLGQTELSTGTGGKKSKQLWKYNSLVEGDETWGYPSGLLIGSVSGSPLDLCH